MTSRLDNRFARLKLLLHIHRACWERDLDATFLARADFDDYDAFKAAHARNGAKILRPILSACGVPEDIVDEACRLVEVHEVGGDPSSDLLKDADSISYFDVNLPLYYQREGWTETKRRSLWGYRRLSARARKIVENINYEEEAMIRVLQEVFHDKSAG